MVEYYCMLVYNIRFMCMMCLIILIPSAVIIFSVAPDSFWRNFDDGGKTALIIIAGVISLSILTLVFLPTSEVIRVMMSE